MAREFAGAGVRFWGSRSRPSGTPIDCSSTSVSPAEELEVDRIIALAHPSDPSSPVSGPTSRASSSSTATCAGPPHSRRVGRRRRHGRSPPARRPRCTRGHLCSRRHRRARGRSGRAARVPGHSCGLSSRPATAPCGCSAISPTRMIRGLQVNRHCGRRRPRPAHDDSAPCSRLPTVRCPSPSAPLPGAHAHEPLRGSIDDTDSGPTCRR